MDGWMDCGAELCEKPSHFPYSYQYIYTLERTTATRYFPMRYTSRRNRTVAVLSAAAAAAAARTIVGATSDFQPSSNNNYNNHAPSDWYYSSPYIYNEIRSVDLSSDDEFSDGYYHQESMTPQDSSLSLLSSFQVSAITHDSDWTDQDDVPSDGGCYVSSQALFS
jgi:hypothetical protein